MKRPAPGNPVADFAVRSTALVISLVLLISGVAATSAAASGVSDTCAPVQILVLAGSGEGGKKSEDTDFEGPTLKRLIDQAQKLTLDDGFSLAGVPVQGIPYSAVPVVQYLKPADGLFESVAEGTLSTVNFMKARQSFCRGGVKFVLAGYSQGVMVVRSAAVLVPKQWTAGVFGLADPFQAPFQPGSDGAGRGGQGVARSFFEAPSPTNVGARAAIDYFHARGVPAQFYCGRTDAVCNFNSVNLAISVSNGFRAHTSYGVDVAERRYLATKILSLVRDATRRTEPAPARPPVLTDVMFAIDTTGSMGPYIRQAVASASRVVAQLRSKSSSVRVGLVEYKDYGDSLTTRTVVPLGDDFGAFESGLQSLSPGGGGDTPEAVYSGVVAALNSEWRLNASRAVVVLGDAPAHDPEPVSGLTKDRVIAAARGLVPLPELPARVGASAVSASSGRVDSGQEQPAVDRAPTALAAPVGLAAASTIPPTSVYALAADSGLEAQMDAISAATGGRTFDLSSPDDVAGSLADSVDSIAGAPIADLALPPTAVAGADVLMSGLSSSFDGTSASFEFDFDGDGVVDATSSDGTATHAFSAGTWTIGLTVVDTQGRRSSTTGTLEVIDPAMLPVVEQQATPLTVSVLPAPARDLEHVLVLAQADQTIGAGTVTFRVDGEAVASCAARPVNAPGSLFGRATCVTAFSSAGEALITAELDGSSALPSVLSVEVRSSSTLLDRLLSCLIDLASQLKLLG